MRTVRSKRAKPESCSTSFIVSRAAGLRSGATASSRSKIKVSAGEAFALAKNFSLLAGTNKRLRRRRDMRPPLLAVNSQGKGGNGEKKKFSVSSLFPFSPSDQI